MQDAAAQAAPPPRRVDPNINFPAKIQIALARRLKQEQKQVGGAVGTAGSWAG